ncbi:MAG: tRNA lysidine(34) synthetase TilS [Janthinobacterium lividum]
MPARQAREAVDRALADALAGVPAWSTLAVALSGGLDSMVLLDALARRGVRPVEPVEPGRAAVLSPASADATAPEPSTTPVSLTCVAIHVHHGLSPAADDWLRHCEQACAARRVPFLHERVTLGDGAGQGIEAAARKARYAVLERLARARGACAVLLAQHADDQAETVLLQMLRGTGLPGLSAMPAQRPLGRGQDASPESLQLLRPFLDLRRDELEAYAAGQALTWVEDPSNQDRRHRRNALRHQVFPAIATHFPDYRRTLARTARHAAAAQALCDELAQADLLTCAASPGTSASGALPAMRVLTRTGLHALSARRLANVLRFWMHGAGLPAASEARLGEMMRQLHAVNAMGPPGGESGARIEIAHAGYLLLGYRDQIFWTHDAAVDGVAPGVGASSAELRYAGQAVWRLPLWRGELRFEACGAGAAAGGARAVTDTMTRKSTTSTAIPTAAPVTETAEAPRHDIVIAAARLHGAVLNARGREGGERLRLGAGRPSRTLKQLFQTAGVAPSQRVVPLFHLDGQLFFVPVLGGCVPAAPTGATVMPDDAHASASPADAAAMIRLRWVPWRHDDP